MFKDLVIEGVGKKMTLHIIKLLSESIEKGSKIPEKISDEIIIDERCPEACSPLSRRVLKIYYHRRA